MIDSGLERAIRERIVQIPIVETLHMDIEALDEGFCRMRVPRKKAYDGVYASFHGGLLMTAADSAACFAILTRIGAEARLTTTDMNIRFLAPCLTDLVVEARVVKAGRTLCPAAVDLLDTHGCLVAVAQVGYIRVDALGDFSPAADRNP